MGIEEQLRAYAQELRDRGVSREQATAMLRARRQQLEGAQARPTPQRQAPQSEDTDGLSLSQYARLAGQGLTFGFGDEIEAALRAGLAAVPGGRSPREAYFETREAAREDIERAYEDRPKTALATEIASGIIPAVLAAVPTGGGSVGARAAAMAPRVARAARSVRAAPILGGAAYGAASGVGAGEDLEGRIGGAIAGAGVGGALGGTARLFGGLRGLASNRQESARIRNRAAEILSDAERRGEAVSEGQALRQAVVELRPERATREGIQSVAEAARATGYTPEQLSRLNVPTGELREAGTMLEVPSRAEARIAAAGLLPTKTSLTPLQRMARGITVTGGPESQAIEEAISLRTLGRNQRMRQALERNARVRRRPYADISQELEQGMRGRAAENYRIAYEKTIPTEEIAEFINRPQAFNWFSRFYDDARAIAAGEVIERKPGAALLPPLATTEEIGGEVVTSLSEEIPVRALDYVQRAMNDAIDAGFRDSAKPLKESQARIWRLGVNNLLEKADELVPEYREARRVYKSDADTQRAFQAAADGGPIYLPGSATATKFKPFMKEDVRKIRSFLENPDVSEVERFRYIQGALDNIFMEFQKAKDAQDFTQTIFGSPAAREKMEFLLGGRKEMIRALQEALPESVLARAGNRILGGSPSVEKLSDATSSGGRFFEAATAAFTGAPSLALRILAQQVFDRFAAAKFFQGLTQARRAVRSEALSMTPRQFAEEYRKVMEQQGAEDLVPGIGNALRSSTTGALTRIMSREF